MTREWVIAFLGYNRPAMPDLSGAKLVCALLALLSPVHSGLEPGDLPLRWTQPKLDCANQPPFIVHEYNPTLFILRQSGCSNFEKPFLYLLFGSREALLIDTGAEGGDPSVPVAQAMARVSKRPGGTALRLLVIHSHGHGDHIANDVAFRRIPGARVVEARQDVVAKFFGLSNWPRQIAQYDLGERMIDIVPIPGHEPASIAVYDRRTGVLLTGDTLYPGRLYVRDPPAFADSIDRLVEFTRSREVSHVLGAHIENTRTPFVDYPQGTAFQPDEHALELGRAHLLELQGALRDMRTPLERRSFRDFTVWPLR